MSRAQGNRRGQPGFVDYFDYNSDGLINGVDTTQFMRRYRTVLRG